MKPLRLATGVDEEIRAAARWYDAQRPGLGGDFAEAVAGLLDEVSKAHRFVPPLGRRSDSFD